MDTRTRKGLGCAALLVYLTIYALAAGALGASLARRTPVWALLIYFAIARVGWVAPLKPLFDWMMGRKG